MIGQKVRLASGGPEMLVTDIDPPNLMICCEWDGGKNSSWFAIVCVDIIRQTRKVDWDWKRID